MKKIFLLYFILLSNILLSQNTTTQSTGGTNGAASVLTRGIKNAILTGNGTGSIASTSAYKYPSNPFYTSTIAEKAVATWIPKSTGPDACAYTDCCWSAEVGIFVAVCGNSGTVKTSPDGINWTLRTAPSASAWHGVIYVNELGLFVCVGGGSLSSVMTSPDGITWTGRTTPNTNNWDGLEWCKELGLLVAVGYSGTGNRVMTSPDGITWTARTSASDNDWADVAWSPELGIMAAVANSGTGDRIMTSPDGIVWTSRLLATDRNWDGIEWSATQGKFVAVSYSSGVSDNAMTSSDGINWTLQTTPTNITLTRIEYAPELEIFVATGAPTASSTNLVTSPDGITWTARTTTNANWGGICWSPELGIFVATSWGGLSMTSTQVLQKNYLPQRLMYGTASYIQPLHVLSSGETINGLPNTTALFQNAGAVRFMLHNTNSSGSRNSSVEMTSDVAKYAFGVDYNANGGNNFWLYDRTASAARLFIESNGNVLIGGSVTDAGFKLDVTGNGRFTTAVASPIGTFSTSVTTAQLIASNKSINTTAGDGATINAIAGRFRKDATGATFTLTNSFITANSILILDQANTAFDATATSWTKVCGAGSVTITFNAAPTSNFDMDFLIIN